MAKYTSGPWEVELEQFPKIKGPRKENGLKDIVCTFPLNYVLDKKAYPLLKANAHLIAAAPLATEILEELPYIIDGMGRLTIWKFPRLIQCAYDNGLGKSCVMFDDENLVNTLAKMWLYLRKEGLIK